MEQPKLITIWPNGNISCFNRNGVQMGELQSISWIALLFDKLEAEGVDMSADALDIHICVNGVWKQAVANGVYEDGSRRIDFIDNKSEAYGTKTH